MKRQLVNHGLWLTVTIVAFVAGSHLARSSKDAGELERAGAKASGTRGVSSVSSKGGSKTRRQSRTKSPGAGELAGELDRGVPADEQLIQLLVRNAIKDGNPLERRIAFDRLLSSLSPENAGLIREAMAENGAGGDHWMLFVYAWGTVDPAAAIAHLPEVEERHRDGFLGNLLRGWASTRPGDAIAYVEGMEAGGRREKMTGLLLDGLADHSIGAATDYLLGLQAGGNANAGRHIDALAREALRVEGLDGAKRWADDLPEGALKAAALDRVANRLVSNDPKEAGQWAEQYAHQDYAWRVVEEVGDEWAKRDPSSAVAWLDDLPDGRGRDEGMRSAMSNWARRDAAGASEYLAAMPESKTRDVAISGFSASLAWKDPETALDWAQSISSNAARLQAVTRAGHAWAHRNKTAATKWVQSAGLPESVQQAILKSSRDRH